MDKKRHDLIGEGKSRQPKKLTSKNIFGRRSNQGRDEVRDTINELQE